MQHLPGAFPHSGLLRAPATLDQQMLSARRNLADRLSGRDRAARCPTRNAAPASETSRPSHSPGCQIAPVGSLIIIGGLLALLGDLSPAPPLERRPITSRLRTE